MSGPIQIPDQHILTILERDLSKMTSRWEKVRSKVCRLRKERQEIHIKILKVKEFIREVKDRIEEAEAVEAKKQAELDAEKQLVTISEAPLENIDVYPIKKSNTRTTSQRKPAS